MSDSAEAAIEQYIKGELPLGVAAMRLLMGSPSAAAARDRIAEAERRLGPGRFDALRAALTDKAFATVAAVLAVVDHNEPGAPSDWARAFDAACAVSPEASVALYSLGDPERLGAATAETVDWLAGQGVLGPRSRVLEIGCGAGRFVEALAPRVGFIAGLDVSPAMAAAARRKTQAHPGAAVVRTSGHDLRAFADESFDLVLAIDSFPYLVKAKVAEAHLKECARVLRPGGELVILNWSYDAPFEPPALAALEPLPLSGRELRLWDGVGFRFRKRTQGLG
jgi:SAM-dependent methyltransferase